MKPALHRAFIGLGANLGDAAATLREAIAALGRIEGCALLRASSLYRTAPMGPGVDGQPDYINAVACVETTLSPQALLEALLALEHRFGRERSVRNAARTLDLDLLLFGECELAEAQLQIPHPRMAERAFVLAPLAEIAPEALIPGQGPVSELLAKLEEQGIARLAD